MLVILADDICLFWSGKKVALSGFNIAVVEDYRSHLWSLVYAIYLWYYFVQNTVFRILMLTGSELTWLGICDHEDIVRSRLKIRDKVTKQLRIGSEMCRHFQTQNIDEFFRWPFTFCYLKDRKTRHDCCSANTICRLTWASHVTLQHFGWVHATLLWPVSCAMSEKARVTLWWSYLC